MVSLVALSELGVGFGRILVLSLASSKNMTQPRVGMADDPSVSMGIYASVLFVLGLADRIGELADPAHDETGRRMEEENLPQRIHLKTTRKKKDE